MSVEGIVLVAALVLLVAVATARADARFDGSRRSDRDELGDDDGPPAGQLAAYLYVQGVQLGRRATLLQLSSTFCQRSRATRAILDDAADLIHGVVHVEIDAEFDHTLPRLLGILSTPTTIVLDSAGREASRFSGVPPRNDLLAALVAVVSR